MKLAVRFLSVFLLLCCISVSVLGQGKGSIYGKVMDGIAPMEFVTVTLFSGNDYTVFEQNTTSDSVGIFLFEGLAVGKYQLKFKLLGFKSSQLKVDIGNDKLNVDAGEIAMLTDTKQLQSVTVASQKSIIKKTAQGFIVNANSNITQAGGTATDLLRNTPTVVVDAEGAITLRGKTPLILINGRNSSITGTDQIPASSIESIEIINNPSAQYDASAEAGIINIKLKKNKQKGTNGALVLGAGLSTKGRVNSSLLLNHKTAKWNIGLAYDNRFAGRIRNIEADRVNFDIPDAYFLNQRRADDRLEKLQNLRLNIDFSPNASNSIGFEATGTLEGQDNNEALTNLLLSKANNFDAKNTRTSREIAKEKVAEFALNYSRQFANKRKEFTANISTSFNKDRENTDINSQAYSATDAAMGNLFLQKTHNYENSNVTNIKTDFVQPLTSKSTIGMGYKAILRYLDADFLSQDNIAGLYVTNTAASNLFTFHEQVHAGYVQYSGFTGEESSPKLKYEIGIRGEQVWNNGNTAGNQIAFSNNYFNVFPTANLAYYKHSNEFWKLSYGRRINRPGLGQLNPFVDITDSLNQHGGNPYLKPELVHSFELGYSKDWEKLSIYSVLYYRIASNTIRGFTVLQSSGVAISKPANFGNVVTYGIENIFSAKPSPKYDFNLSVSLFQQNIDGGSKGYEVANNVFSWYGKLINNFALWGGSKLQITGVYNAPIALPQGRRIAIYNVDLGLQQKLGKGNARLGLVVTDIFNTQKSGQLLTGSNFTYNRIAKVDTRAILVTFACTFGGIFKEKLLENKFSND
jgi:hypothetical protein